MISIKTHINNVLILFNFLSVNCLAVWAGEQVGVVTSAEGVVKLFSHPSPTLTKPSDVKFDSPQAALPHALFEGQYYLVSDVKVGDRVGKGNILRTSPGAKARVIYDNGDQIMVGSSTAYRVSWDTDTAQAHTEIQLAYGKLRGIIEKGGPRTRLKIKTKSAVMGVRGTDFFIAQGGGDDSTEVTIMRGSVEVTPLVQKSESVKTVEVKAGYSAEVKPSLESQSILASVTGSKSEMKVSPAIELRRTTQNEFVGIQKSSQLSGKMSQKTANEEIQKNILLLEQKASVTAMKDIQLHDSRLYSFLNSKVDKKMKLEDVNQVSLSHLQEQAPKGDQHKPYKSEIEDIDDGAYTKYFKKMD